MIDFEDTWIRVCNFLHLDPAEIEPPELKIDAQLAQLCEDGIGFFLEIIPSSQMEITTTAA